LNAQEDESSFFVFLDKAALRSSKQISQITVSNCRFRLILNRDGTAFLIGRTEKLEEGYYTGNLITGEDTTKNAYFESLSYLVEKLGIMRLPTVIEGIGYDFCLDSFEIISGGASKKVSTSPEGFVPELAALSALLQPILENVEFRPYLPASELTNLKLNQITRIAPKRRVQDKDRNKIKVVEYLIAVGKPSIPWLIEQLDDETKIDHQVMDYWYQTQTGDVALIVLSNFFEDRARNPTVPGFGWDSFLERKNPEAMAEQILRTYIARFGRSKMKSRWQEMWQKNKDDIDWDWDCYCYRIREEK
jgi:hypothetical protein